MPVKTPEDIEEEAIARKTSYKMSSFEFQIESLI
jgi:hypothetical protein